MFVMLLEYVTHKMGHFASTTKLRASAPTPSKKSKTRTTQRKGRIIPDDNGDDEVLPASPPTKQTHACNKTSFASVFRPTAHNRTTYLARLLVYRNTMHLLVRHATSFLRYHILKYHCVHNSFPPITDDHFHAILYLLNKLDAWNPKPGGKQDLASLKIALLPDLRAYIHLVGFTPPNLKHDQQPIRYLAASLNTNLTVNVSEHFVKMLLRYINLRLGNAESFMVFSLVILSDTESLQMSRLKSKISKDTPKP